MRAEERRVKPALIMGELKTPPPKIQLLLAEVELRRAPGLDRAEIARARADFAQNHERGGAARPAFADVRATCALADSVQLVLLHHMEGRLVG